MYDLLTDKFHDPIKAWDNFIDFLAVDNCGSLLYQINHKFEWLVKDSRLVKSLQDTYDNGLLRSDFYDHLGEMYLEKVVGIKQVQQRGQYLTPMNVAESMAVINVGKTDKKVKVLDPAVGTGRLLMAAYKQAPNGVFFGVDVDIRMVRIAFTNFAIHGISGYLLHADSLIHEIDISEEEGRNNWQYANKWYSCIEKLKPITSTNKLLTNKNDQLNIFRK